MSRAPYLLSRAPKKDNFWWRAFRAFSSSTLDGADRTRPHLATCTVPLRDSLTCPHKYLDVVRHVDVCMLDSMYMYVMWCMYQYQYVCMLCDVCMCAYSMYVCLYAMIFKSLNDEAPLLLLLLLLLLQLCSTLLCSVLLTQQFNWALR